MSLFGGMIDKAMGICNQTFGDKQLFYFKETPETPFIVDGIFDPEGTVVDNTGDFPVETKCPILGVRKSDVTNKGFRLPEQGDWVKIATDGITYEITRKASVDDGWSEIRFVMMIKGSETYA